MKLLFLAIALLTTIHANAMSVKDAFRSFYNDSKISSNHCGQNIHYFIQYLKRNNVRFNSGYVVSLHDDFAALNHFDARWGSKETFAEGGVYYRSNWYFHVFAVIDGVAYDFSQREMQTQELEDYLMKAYIPKGTTENIFFLGRLNKQKAMQAHVNMKVKIYPLEGYGANYGPTIYEGTSIELINYALGNRMISQETKFDKFSTTQQSKKFNTDGTITIKYPKLITEHGTLPIMADAAKLCRTYGFFGAIANKTEHEVSDEMTMLKIYSSLKKENPENLTSRDITVSYQKSKTVGGVPSQPLLHYAKSVTCSDLYTVLNNI